jgi:RND family efflux transporter MFP subunit
LVFAFALPLALLAVGCKRPATPPEAALPLPSATVRVQPLQSASQPLVEDVVGTVRAKQRVAVEAKLSGRIERLNVTVGQTVKAGDVLYELDVREIRARLDQAQALRQQAERDLKRFAALLQQEAVTQAEYDAVEARQRVAAASVSEAETMLGYARGVVPFDGVITRKLAEVGDLATPGRTLLEIEDPQALRLEADVPEALLSRVRPGARLPVRIETMGTTLEGTVAEMAPSADAASRTFRVTLDLPATPGLRTGQFGRVTVPVGEAQSVRAPFSAVVIRGQMEIVFVVTNQTARLRLVKLGKRLGETVELLSGVVAGEVVVVEGAATLLDGQPVQTK